MKLNILLAGAAVALLASATAAAASTELVTNGSFETGDFSGWSLTGNTGFTGVTGNFSGIDPTDGAEQAFFGPVGSDGVLSQTIATTAGQSYVFSFDLFNFGGAPNDFTASFDGAAVLSYADDGGFAYSSNTFNVVASGDTTTVSFAVRQDPSYYLLDHVSVTAGVPEPATWALMLTGFFGAGALLRSRREQKAIATA